MQIGTMKQTSIRRLIIGSFAVVMAAMLAMLAMGIIAYLRIGDIKQHAHLVETDTTVDLHSAAELAITWGQRYSLLQSHVLLEGQDALRSVEERLQAAQATIQRLSKLQEAGHRDGTDRGPLHRVEGLDELCRNAEAEVLRLSRADRDAKARPPPDPADPRL
jgi:hypothetical protein